MAAVADNEDRKAAFMSLMRDFVADLRRAARLLANAAAAQQYGPMKGQGAPITPLADWVLFRDEHESRAIANLGGFCNITLMGPERRDRLVADVAGRAGATASPRPRRRVVADIEPAGLAIG